MSLTPLASNPTMGVWQVGTSDTHAGLDSGAVWVSTDVDHPFSVYVEQVLASDAVFDLTNEDVHDAVDAAIATYGVTLL